MPVDEEFGLTLLDSVQPLPRPGWFAPQSFEFLHGPPEQVLIDAPCKEVQLGAIEGPVVVDPAPHLRIDLLGEPGQVRATATVEVPAPDLLTDRLARLGAHCR